VPGGLSVMSYTTRLTSDFNSRVILSDIFFKIE